MQTDLDVKSLVQIHIIWWLLYLVFKWVGLIKSHAGVVFAQDTLVLYDVIFGYVQNLHSRIIFHLTRHHYLEVLLTGDHCRNWRLGEGDYVGVRDCVVLYLQNGKEFKFYTLACQYFRAQRRIRFAGSNLISTSHKRTAFTSNPLNLKCVFLQHWPAEGRKWKMKLVLERSKDGIGSDFFLLR